MKRLGLLLVVLLVGVTVLAGAQAKPALKLLGISRWNPNPTWAPTDTSLQKAIAAAANAYVGRSVTLEWGNFPPDTTYVQFLQMREAAGNLPEILLLDDLHNNAEAYEYAIKKGLIKSFTLADFQKYMPGYVARFKQYGVDINFALSENSKTVGETGKGKNWYIPFQFGSASFPAAKVPNNFSKPSPNAGPTGGMFRDDLLKKVYPTAKTEAEFRQFMLDKNGKLTLEDMLDVPMQGWADLYKYGKAVKALNAKVGEKPVIPLGGVFGSSESAASYFWSQTSATGYMYKGNFWWQDPPIYLKSVDKSPELREQARWFNRMYNEGLLDPEIFVMRNDQYFAKIGNGEYGVFAWHFVPKDNAIKVGKERGYGWRPVPFFFPNDMSRVNNKYSRVSFWSIGIYLTSKVKAADLPDVMKYIDYFMTEKSDDLAYWGLPAWSTGTGTARKFKPEYKALEDWAVFGKEGGKDGTYFGLGGGAAISMAEGAHYQYGTKPFAFFQISGQTYPNAPYWSYRANPSWDSKAELQNVDLMSWVNNWWYYQYIGPATTYYRINKGWDWWSYMFGSEAAAKYNANLDNTMVNGLIARAITGSVTDFDDNWDMYVQYLIDGGLNEYEADTRASLKANWESNILQSIVK